jgi:hypothetical protein
VPYLPVLVILTLSEVEGEEPPHLSLLFAEAPFSPVELTPLLKSFAFFAPGL